MRNSERLVAERLTAQGWSVQSDGWPDLFARQGDRTLVVEVKTKRDPISPDQRRMLDFFAGFIEVAVDRDGQFSIWQPTPPPLPERLIGVKEWRFVGGPLLATVHAFSGKHRICGVPVAEGERRVEKRCKACLRTIESNGWQKAWRAIEAQRRARTFDDL